jgi:hypothetical protein
MGVGKGDGGDGESMGEGIGPPSTTNTTQAEDGKLLDQVTA